MTNKQDLGNIIQGILSKDVYELYIWAKWFSEKHSCSDCVETHISLNKGYPDCLKCLPNKSLINKRFKNMKLDNVDEGCSVKHTITHKISRKKEICNETQQKKG